MTSPMRFAGSPINRAHLATLIAREEKKFVADHPKSAALYERAQHALLGGVPMNWMKKWAGQFPVFVAEAHGAHFTDVDGRDYVDLCLGDTGAMTGHSPRPQSRPLRANQSKASPSCFPRKTRCGSAKNSRAASVFRTGNSLLPPPMRIVSRFASLVKSRRARKFSFTTTATTAASTRASSRSSTENPPHAVATSVHQ